MKDIRVKFPHTKHVPWSLGSTSDDKFHYDLSHWYGTEIIITEKMDGENTSAYKAYLHARSPDSKHHESRNQIKELHSIVAMDIPEGWRICGENMTAVHSIKYENLESIFLIFNIWNENNIALSWDDTVYWANLLNLKHVPILWQGIYDNNIEKLLQDQSLFPLNLSKQEGYVIRPTNCFRFEDYEKLTGKFVRKGHVQTDQHWLKKPVEYNSLRS